jgi:hypothetical protein
MAKFLLGMSGRMHVGFVILKVKVSCILLGLGLTFDRPSAFG